MNVSELRAGPTATAPHLVGAPDAAFLLAKELRPVAAEWPGAEFRPVEQPSDFAPTGLLLFLVSDAFRGVVERLGGHDIEWLPVTVRGDYGQEFYLLHPTKAVDCLHPSTQWYAADLVARPVIDPTKVEDQHLFAIPGGGPRLFASAELASALGEAGLSGIHLTDVPTA